MNKKIIKIGVFDKNTPPSIVKTRVGDAILDSICLNATTNEDLETGEYYLDCTFLIDNECLHTYLQEESILKVQMDYGNEYFVIAKIRKSSKNIVVFARQLTIAETLDLWLEDVRPENQNGQGALSWIFNFAKGKKDIRISSDISTISTAYYMDMSMYKALHDCEQSFTNRWGGEIQRRGYDLAINKRIGTHRGVQIRSRKNLTGFEANTDIDKVVTRIKPKGFNGITIDGYVDSPLINTYRSIKTREIKYEDVKVKDENNQEGFDTLKEAQQELIRRANLEFTENNIDKIRADYRINFVQLEQTEEYKNYVQSERVYLGDELDVYEDKLDINITVRSVRRKFDVLKQRVLEIELTNEVKKDKTPTINDVLNGLDKIENEVVENNKWVENAINNATALIENGLKDSYVVVRKNEILIMDTKDINTAINVWRWNNGGFAHSKTGYYGEYETAITQDGSIVARFITGLVVNGEQINTKNLNSINNEGKKTLEVTADGDIILRPKIFEILAGSSSNVFTKSEVSDKVSNAKKELNESIDSVKDSVVDLKDYTNGAFKDNLLTEDEKGIIKSYLNPLESNFSNVTKEYSVLYSNPLLLGVAKTNLQKAYNSYKLKYDGLINTINSLLNLSSISGDNKIALDNAYNEHDNMLANYRQRASEAIDSISSQKASDALNSAKTYTNAQIKVANDEINLKVSKKEYDENKNVINDKFTKFEQTFDDFNFKFQNVGSPNEVDDSNFGNNSNRWQLANSSNVPAKIEYSLNYNGGDISCTNAAYIGDCSFDKSANFVQKIYPKNNRMTKFTLSGCYHYNGVRHGGGIATPIASLYMEIHNKDGTVEYYNHSNLLNEGIENISWKTIHQTYTRSGKAIDYIKLFVYKRNTVGTLRITQIDLHENHLSRKWIPGSNELKNHITSIDANGVKVDSKNTEEFARIDEEFFCVYSGGESPVNRRAFMGLVDGVPTVLLGANGINPGVSVFGGTHAAFKHYAPSKSPLDWGGSWGMFEYKLDSGTNHISRMGFNQIGNIEFIPHSSSHFYKNLNVHGNNDYEVSASMGIFQTYMKDWSGGITANLRGVKVYEHVIGSDNGSDIHCINKSGGRSRIHASFINITSAYNAYDLGLDTPKVYKSDTQVQVDLGEAVESLIAAKREQEKDIVANLLATIETYEIMLELNPQIANNKKRKNRMSEVYATLINKNEINIDDIPLNIVDIVRMKLNLN